MRRGFALGLALGLALSAGVARAAWVRQSTGGVATRAGQCVPGTPYGSKEPTADAYASQQMANANFGTSTDLVVQGNVGGSTPFRLTFIKFPAFSVPAGCRLTGATLRLTKPTGTLQGQTLTVQRASSDWIEGGGQTTCLPPTCTGMTWNNGQPAVNGAFDEVTFATNPACVCVVTFSVLSVFQQGVPFGIRVADHGSSMNGFCSRECSVANRPTLTLTWGW